MVGVHSTHSCCAVCWLIAFFCSLQIGVMVMVHGDDTGLVLPPRIAPTQCVLVWILASKESEETKEAVKAVTLEVRTLRICPGFQLAPSHCVARSE